MVAALVLAPPAGAVDQIALPANDLNPLLGLTGVSAPTNVPVQSNPEPKLKPVPAANCGEGSDELKGQQGRVTAEAIRSPGAKDGWTCNLSPVGHVGGAGGWRVWRYVDRAGHECAYYDTALVRPLGAIAVPGLPGTGVMVLDMSDPAHPKPTDLLDDLPMQAPHESLNLNKRRGLLAAEMGSGGTAPGLLSVYDVSRDCRHPVRKSTTLAARFGHESGFSPDGKTFWMGGGVGLAAIDLNDPSHPKNIWEGAEFVHGLSVSRTGNRLFVADPINGNLTIMDSSEVQARKPDAEVREISRLTWDTVSIPQNTAPMVINGKRYLLEFDEFGFRFTGFPQDLQQVGAARIIDISDMARPRVVSNLRLQVNQPETHAADAGDPGALSPVQSYAAHYCAIPRQKDPQIVACSFINSGLRIFDIRNPMKPREVAYYVAPPAGGLSNLGQASNFAMSQPAFDPERRQVWYSDAISGFWSVRLDKSVWRHPMRIRGGKVKREPASVKLAGAPTGPAPVQWSPEVARQIALLCLVSPGHEPVLTQSAP
ncbi:MAG: hypothetical protein QOG62_1246 [Thermoleophilaceae bacterium]|nr:hypothetical protein [Thermoleophilaceae bacterium]